jgi:hypothetical protein
MLQMSADFSPRMDRDLFHHGGAVGIATNRDSRRCLRVGWKSVRKGLNVNETLPLPEKNRGTDWIKDLQSSGAGGKFKKCLRRLRARSQI